MKTLIYWTQNQISEFLVKVCSLINMLQWPSSTKKNYVKFLLLWVLPYVNGASSMIKEANKLDLKYGFVMKTIEWMCFI